MLPKIKVAFAMSFISFSIYVSKGDMNIILKQEKHEKCNMFLLGMSSDFIARTNYDNLAYGKIIFNITSNFTKINQYLLRQYSGCVVGVAPVSQFGALHRVLLSTLNKRMVLLTDPSEVDPIPPAIKISRMHHPPMVIQQGQARISVKVACHNGEVVIIGYVPLKNNGTVAEIDILSGMDLEKLCNSGKHPLSGKHLKVSTFSQPPFLIISEDYSHLQGGVALDMFNALADHFDFKWKPKIVVDWAIFYPNGSIEGSLGELLKGNVDLSLEQPIMGYGQFGTWTHYPYAHNMVFIEPIPKLLPKAMNLLHPLDIYSWLSITTSVIVMSIVFLMLDKLKDGNMKYIESLFMTYGIVFQEYYQPSQSKHRKNSKNILRLIWVIATLLLTASYTGNLKSHLIKKTYEEKTQTIDEMIDKDMPVHLSRAFFHYLDSLKHLSKLYMRLTCQANKDKSKFYTITRTSVQDAIDLIGAYGGGTLMYEQSVQVLKREYFKRGQSIPFVIIPEWFASMQHAPLFRKYDQRAAYFDLPIFHLVETGIIQHYFNKLTPFRDITEQKNTASDETQLVLEHFGLLFLFCIVGLLSALIILLCEHVVNRSCMMERMTYMK